MTQDTKIWFESEAGELFQEAHATVMSRADKNYHFMETLDGGIGEASDEGYEDMLCFYMRRRWDSGKTKKVAILVADVEFAIKTSGYDSALDSVVDFYIKELNIKTK